ncbi:hypothetical protein CLOSBL3_12196 [Clostridiaceae bacterium BL-3]|nr:hypothetical protein CLOSBL3_12196 [Clostridiaceae bacterium BL-3]
MNIIINLLLYCLLTTGDICDIILLSLAEVVELADATDSKSVDSDIMRVRLPPPAP